MLCCVYSIFVYYMFVYCMPLLCSEDGFQIRFANSVSINAAVSVSVANAHRPIPIIVCFVGTSSANKSPLWGIRFRHWLGGVLVDMRRKSPVQQWVDSIPRQDQKPVVRATSQDDISVTSETVNQLVSPLKSVNIQSSGASLGLGVDKREKFLSSGSNEDSDVFEMGISARTEACDLYSSSVDSTLVKRTKPPFFRDRSINSEGNSPRHKNALFRDSSLQVIEL